MKEEKGRRTHYVNEVYSSLQNHTLLTFRDFGEFS
jgi:hypothetical protein